ncbi:MAG: hypothetical protein ACO3ZZ_04925, partial [Solirubrobacterales bacterium]
MARGSGRDPYDDDGRRHMRYLVIGLIAVIIGLVVAIIVLAGSDSGSDQTGSQTPDLPAREDQTDEGDSGGVTPEPEPEPAPDDGGTTPDGGDSGGS